MKYAIPSLLALVGLMGVALTPAAQADPVYKTTQVTFSAPVEIPGMVLPAGTYVMKLLDPYVDRSIVRFYNRQQNHMYAMVFAVPDYRLQPTDHTVVTFEERAHGAPQALKAWFPAGDNWGEEFVYPKAHLTAAATAPTAPQKPVQAAQASAPAPVPAPQQNVSRAPAQPAQSSRPPVEIAQAQPAPAPNPSVTPSAEQPKELPKTASDLPFVAFCGATLVLAGAILRRRSA